MNDQSTLNIQWPTNDEIFRTLDQIPVDLRNKALRSAMQAAGRVVAKAMQAKQSRVRTGMLDASIGFKVLLKPGRPAVLIVGPRKSTVRVMDRALGRRIRKAAGWKKRAMNGKQMAIGWHGGISSQSLANLSPTRYAHLVNKRWPFLRPTMSFASGQVRAIVRENAQKTLDKLKNK